MPRQMTNRTLRRPESVTLAWSHYPGVEGMATAGRVVLIHALAMDRRNWDGVISALPKEVAVLAVDCRGHGRSTGGEGPFTLDGMADDIIVILDAEGWSDAVFAGCSMGGCIAQAIAARHGARVSSLALIDTTAWYGEDAEANWADRAQRASEEGLASLLPFQRERWFSAGFLAEHPEQVAAIEAVFLSNDLGNYVRACAMLGEADLRPFLAEMQMPAHVLVGSEDYATPPEGARFLTRSIPSAQLTILDGARHFTPVECPEQVAAAIAGLTVGSDA